MHLPPLADQRRRTRRTLLAAVLPAALATAALPAAAHAADVTLVGTEIVVEDRSSKFGQGGDNNRLIAESLPGGELRLVDQVPLVSRTATCLAVSSFELRCIRPSNSPISRLVYSPRGGDDQLRPTGSLPIRFAGGSGDDLYVGARSGAGTRVEFIGGDDFGDLAHYTNATTAVHVNKDGVANDGRPGLDRDNIGADVEVVTGTNFGDRLVGADVFALEEEFRPRGGNDVVLAGPTTITTVDMGTAKDGADRIVGEHAIVSYAGRTNPIRASVGLDGADDGEAGEGDELVDVRSVRGGSGADTMFSAARRFGITLDGGAGDDKVIGTAQNDGLTGGPGRDVVFGDSGSDRLFTDDGEVDRVLCGDGFADVARTDTAELEISGCETVEKVGTLLLAPKVLTAEAGETARLRLSWTHPQSWRKLRKVELRLTRDGRPVGEVTMRPRAQRISADGAVKLVRKQTRLTRKGKTVAARLAVRVDESLAGQTLKAEVEATDTRGRRQLERGAATVRVAS